MSEFDDAHREQAMVGELLCWLRRLHALSPEEAASQAGLTVKRLNALETGNADMTVDELKAFAALYAVMPGFFFLPFEYPEEVAKVLHNTD